MKVRQRTPNQYLKMAQRGGLPVFRGLPRYKMRGTGFLSSLAGKVLRTKVLPMVKKQFVEKVVPIALESGSDIISGRKTFKQAMKSGLKKGKSALKQEVEKYVSSGGNLLTVSRGRKSRSKGRKSNSLKF